MEHSLAEFVRKVRATVMVVSLGCALLMVMAITVAGWALRDGLLTAGPASHGWEAWRRFLKDALPGYLVCGVIALPGLIHFLLKRREERLLRQQPVAKETTGEPLLSPGWQTLWTVCMCYGAAFGAVCGTLCGLMGHEPAAALLYGPPAGMVVGSLSACIYVAVGACVRGPAGWSLAGLLACLAPTALMGFLLGRNSPEVPMLIGLTLVGLIGGCLGLAVAHGVDTGQSRVPGMQGLVEIIQETTHSARGRTAPGTAAEVAPAAAPSGRGDEATPIGEAHGVAGEGAGAP